jgi:arylsulfatase A
MNRNRILATIMLVVLALQATFHTDICHAQNADRPNLIILFADDMGYGDLGCFGHPTIRTPHLDQMADEGLRLTSFYVAPWCVPSRSQLMLGRYSVRTPLGRTGSGGDGGIPDNEVTLPQSLKAAGYKTGMVGKWHLGYQQEKYLPVGKGFDYWFGLPYSNDMRRPWVNTDVPLWLYENTKKIEHPVNQNTLTTRYTEKATQFIKENQDGPFFLYLAYSMPHLPVRTRNDFRGKSRSGLYGDVIQTIDWSVGDVLKALEDTGAADNTLVVFTSDNGPWLNLPARMLQDGNKPWHAGSPGLLRGSKATTYEGGVRTPCIVKWPAKIAAGRRSAEIVSSIDFYRTFVTLGKGNMPTTESDSYDLIPFLLGETEQSPRKDFYYFHGRRLDGLRAGPWKIRYKDGLELFHLDLDPAEKYNRAGEKPLIVERLTDQLEAMAQATNAQRTWKQ